jgi:hypothetical protein
MGVNSWKYLNQNKNCRGKNGHGNIATGKTIIEFSQFKLGYKREIFTSVPKMAWLFGIGIILIIVLLSIRLLGGI